MPEDSKPYHNVAMIKGDLNGITVSDAVLKVNDAVTDAGLLSKPVAFTQMPYNADYFLEKGIKELGDEEIAALSAYDQIFKGPVGDPTRIAPGVLEVGILLALRQRFDQYVNLRPVVLPEGVPSVIVGKTSKDINFEICRENSEGLYCNAGWVEKKGTDDESAYQLMKCTYKGVKRLAEFALERAIARKKGEKPVLHVAFKSNILTFAASPWVRVYEELKKRKDVVAKYIHIDNFAMQMVTSPEQFDVVLTENMFGDITTDLGAVLSGGIGTGVSGNINPTGKFPSMFEPIHGSVPDRWYDKDANGEYVKGTFRQDLVQTVKPEAAIRAYAMMLRQMKEARAADAVDAAALANIRNPDYKVLKLDELVQRACESVRRAA